MVRWGKGGNLLGLDWEGKVQGEFALAGREIAMLLV